jgi:hypothetical protein
LNGVLTRDNNVVVESGIQPYLADCKLNMADEAYRLYSVAKLAREREYNGYINATSVRADPGAEVHGGGGADGGNGWHGGRADPSMPFSGAVSSAPVGLPNGGGPEAGALIRCRKCRRLVARGNNSLPHQPGVGLDAFSWHQRRYLGTKHGGEKATVAAAFGEAGASAGSAATVATAEQSHAQAAAAAAHAAAAAGTGSVTGAGAGAGAAPGGFLHGGGASGGFGALGATPTHGPRLADAPPCQNVFLEPLAWMDGIEEGMNEGKLCCPRCDVKVGYYNWSGCQCSCGAWVTPAFYVQLGKVDVLQVAAAPAPGAGGGGGGAGSGPAPVVTKSPVAGAVRMPRKFAAAPRPAVQRPSARKVEEKE